MRRVCVALPALSVSAALVLSACSGGGGSGSLGEALSTVTPAALTEERVSLRFSDAIAVEEAYSDVAEADRLPAASLMWFGLPEPRLATPDVQPANPFLTDDAGTWPVPSALAGRALSVDAPGRPFSVMGGVGMDWERTVEVFREAGWTENGDRVVAPNGGMDMEASFNGLLYGVSVVGAVDDTRVLAADEDQYDSWYGDGSLLDDDLVASLAACLGDVALAHLVPRFTGPPQDGAVSAERRALIAADDVNAYAWGISLADPDEPRAVFCLVPAADADDVATEYEDAWPDLLDPIDQAPMADALPLVEAGTEGDAVRVILGAGKGETDVQRAQLLMTPILNGWLPGIG